LFTYNLSFQSIGSSYIYQFICSPKVLKNKSFEFLKASN
jgi:hypothetical protein